MTNLSNNDIKRIAEGLKVKIFQDEHGTFCLTKQGGRIAGFNPKAPEHVLAMLKQLKMWDNDLLIDQLILNHDSDCDRWWFSDGGHDWGPMKASETMEDAIIAAYLEYLG